MSSKNFFKINLIYFIALVMVACLFVLGYSGIITNSILSSVLIQIVTMLSVPLLLYTLLVSKDFKKTLSDLGFKKISFNMVLIAIALGFLLYFLNSFVASFFDSVIYLFGYESINLNIASTTVSATLAQGSSYYGVLIQEFVLGCIFPAICEEVLHRGMLLSAGKRYAHPRYCLYISSLLFGLMHLNIGQFFYATILGFLMGVVLIASQSIYPTMIIHFMNNALSTYMFYGRQLNWKIPTAYYNFISFLASNSFLYIVYNLISVAGIVALYLLLIKQLKRQRAKLQVRYIVKNLNFENLSPQEMAEKIQQTNYILAQAKGLSIAATKERVKFKFVDNIFTICSIVTAGLITICSFIWGIL